MRHLTQEEIDKLLANRLRHAEQEGVVRHLLAGCGLCSRQVVEQAPDLLLEQAAEDRHRKAILITPRGHALAAATEQEERWRADERKLDRSRERLEQSSGGDATLASQQARGLRGLPLIEALLQRAWELRFLEPRTVRWLTYNAVKAAESLSPEEYPPAFVLDLQARVWGELANAYRMNAELAEAEAAFGKARALWRRGSGDPRCLARLAELEGSLRNSQERWLEARELFDRTYRLYTNLGERHLAGQALLAKGNAVNDAGGVVESVKLLQKGLALLDRDRDPTAVLMGTQTLIAALGTCGEFRAAGELLLRSGLRQSFGNNEFGILKVRMVEALVLQGLGRLSSAERALLAAREGFRGLGRTIDSAIVGLKLLPVWRQMGRSRQVQSTARELHGTFQDLGLREAAVEARRYLW